MADQDGIIVVDRKTLYEEVWATPGRTLARKYGISDVALAKACHRHQIPRPPRGHWAKLAAGKASKQLPLPPSADPQLLEVRFYGGIARPRGFHDPDLAVTSQKRQVEPKIVVPDRLASPHALVAKTRDCLKARRAGDTTADTPHHGTLAISVTPGSEARALRIMDTLIKAWESLGGAVSAAQDRSNSRNGATYFSMGEDRVSVFLEERFTSVRSKEPYSWRRERKYTGQLMLRFDASHGTALRATWADGKRQHLESILDSVITGLLQRVDHEKQDRLDRQIHSRQARCVAERREAAKRRETEEKKLRESLEEQVQGWEHARRIREYLAAMDEGLANGKLRMRDEQAYSKWSSWARWYADHVDPLIRAAPLPDEVLPPVNTPAAEIEFTSHTKPIIGRLGVADADALYGLSREEIQAAEGNGRRGAWQEICDVLEGLGYDVSDRNRNWWA